MLLVSLSTVRDSYKLAVKYTACTSKNSEALSPSKKEELYNDKIELISACLAQLVRAFHS